MQQEGGPRQLLLFWGTWSRGEWAHPAVFTIVLDVERCAVVKPRHIIQPEGITQCYDLIISLVKI